MPQGRAGSLESLRRLNRLRVIRALRDEGTISRAEIARREELAAAARRDLAAQLAQGLRGRVAGAPAGLGDEEFLERLAVAKATAGGD